jgi:hypothetical protein
MNKGRQGNDAVFAGTPLRMQAERGSAQRENQLIFPVV